MMRYIPGFILQQYKSNIFNGIFGGFALLFDIADFTPITTIFNKHGKQGAEELRAFLDFAFGGPIRTVESYGGFITLFAGDAFCAIFPDKTDRKSHSLAKNEKPGPCSKTKAMSDKDRVLNAVLNIRRFFMDKEIYQCALGDFKLKIRQTVTYGDISWQIFKNDLQNEYVFYGKPFQDLAELSNLKEDILFSNDAAEKIGVKSFKKIKKDGYKYIKESKIAGPDYTESEECPSDYPAVISGFINPKYQNLIPQPEIRSATFCFANLGNIAFKDRGKAINHIQVLADKYGGFVTRYDATDKGMVALILFGMPISQERILERICRFALEIIAKVPLLAIGLAKGNVYAGYTGSGNKKEYTALGTAVNLAARLMGKAGPGDIITDTYFYRELMDKFLFKEIGPIQLKGIKKPIMSYRLDKQLFERRSIKQANFTGRDKPFVEIKQVLNDALSKNNNLVIYIYGNAGIGKSRLCDELMDCFHSKSYHRFFLYCDSVIQRSYETVKQIIRQYFLTDFEQLQKDRISDFRDRWKLLAGQDNELIRIESIIASILGYEWEMSIWSVLPSSEKPKQQKFAFLRFMAEIALKKPVIIHLDDGQWIDEESRAYLQALSEAEVKQIQIICSCRYLDDGRKPDLYLKNHTKVEKDLEILDEESSGEMIRHILKLHMVPRETLEEINSRAMGNPFFIEQLCAYLKEIEKIDSKGRLTEYLGPVASFQISDIIGSRIDRLTANVQECVYNASVLGMEFNVTILSKMLKRPLRADLEYGKSNMIWKDLKELQYIFSHILIKDTAYLRIMYNKLKKLHSLAAEAMEKIYKDSIDEHAQEIALHYEKADIPNKEAFYYDKAGCWFRDKYNFIKGELFLKKALEIREKLFGTEHSDTAISLYNLGLLYMTQGKYSEAEPLYKLSLRIREKLLGRDHTDVALSLNNLANLHLDQGRYIEAEPLYKRALLIYEKSLGKGHSDYARSLINLAILYKLQGKYTDAEPLCYRSLCILEKSLGRDHPYMAYLLNTLANLYDDQGKYSEAEPLYKQSLYILEKSLGKDHPHVAASLNNLAVLYMNQNKYIEAEPLYKHALMINEKILGKDHLHVTAFLNNLAVLYMHQCKYLEAEDLYKRSLLIKEKSLGKDHPDVAAILTNLADLYMAQGKHSKAEILYNRSLKIKEKALGKDHPVIVYTLNGLADLYQKRGKYLQAESLLKRVVKIAESALGADNPLTVEYRKKLEDCQEAMKYDS